MELARHPMVLDAVQQLIGPDFLLWGCQVFCKPGGTGMEVPMHQVCGCAGVTAGLPSPVCLSLPVPLGQHHASCRASPSSVVSLSLSLLTGFIIIILQKL